MFSSFLKSFFGPFYPVFHRLIIDAFGKESWVSFVFWLKTIGGILSLVFLFGLLYNISVLSKLKRRHPKELVKMFVENDSSGRASRWENIKSRFLSDNSSDWRQGILEADKLVEDIFKRVGYKNLNLSEILLKMKPYMLQSLPHLLSAHNVRNRIVREVGAFELTKEKALETVGFYEEVLEELEYI